MTTEAKTPEGEDHLSKMEVHIRLRILAVKADLKIAETAVVDATLHFESVTSASSTASDSVRIEAVSKLAEAENRRDKLASELRRLAQTNDGLAERIQAAREQEAQAQQRALGAKYIHFRDEHHALSLELVKRVEELAPLAQKCAKAADEAMRLSRQLGLNEGRDALTIPIGWLEALLRHVLVTAHARHISGGTARVAHDAKERLGRPWRWPGSETDRFLTELGLPDTSVYDKHAESRKGKR
jgi:hypothetical protein